MGLLSDIGGLLGGAQGAKDESKFVGQAMDAQANAIKAMLALQKAGMGFSSEMFDKAMAQMNAVGPAMRQQLLAQGKQKEAQMTSNSLGTGLTGTTAHSGFVRGVTADTGQNLAQLEGGLASQRAGMYQQRGSEMYQQYLDRANIRQRTKYDPFLQNFQFGQMGQAGAEAGAGLGGLLGTVGGFFMPGGGGIGGLLGGLFS